jgi:hypothetical protein
MEIPFTVEQFFDVFETYNTAIWPVQILAYGLGIVALFLAIYESRLSTPLVSGILAFFWIWTGVFYHILYFNVINPAAKIFGIFYILQGLLFLLLGTILPRLAFRINLKLLPIIGGCFILYAMVVYPPSGYQFRACLPQSPNVWRRSVSNDDLHFWNIAVGKEIGARLSRSHPFSLVYCWHERSGGPADSSRLWACDCRSSRDGLDPDSEAAK